MDTEYSKGLIYIYINSIHVDELYWIICMQYNNFFILMGYFHQNFFAGKGAGVWYWFFTFS
jgi:hypothetical protein